MMRGAIPAKLAALSVAIILHGAFALSLLAKDEVQVEGAGGGTEVRLGNAFADMAAGTLAAERPVETEMPSADVRDRIKAEQAEAMPPDKTVSLPEAERAEPLPLPVEQTAEVVATEKPSRLVPAPGQAVQPQQPETLEAAPAHERLEGSAPDRSPVTRAPRPRPRGTTLEAARKPAGAAKRHPKPARPTAAQPGNAARNARAGAATGKRDAVARQSGNGGRQQAAGNAAVSNYPGLVMRKLSRSGKPRVNARGTAVVAFRVSANGGLAKVSLARSSGSAALDQAAVQLVRGAAPFPKPPQGARRSFSIQIKGR